MSKIYLPRADQFDLMNENLAKIANAIGSDIDISTWAGVQKAVRVGVAPDLIPVGTQLSVTHSVYGDLLLDVVAHNYFKSAHDENAHTMTLMCHDIPVKLQYDAPEAFYTANEPLSPGIYHFTIPTTFESWEAGTYEFTLKNTLPKGGQLCMVDMSESPLEEAFMIAFESSTSTVPKETEIIVSLGNRGTNLGTLGVELNHVQRVGRGSSNYKESAIRQFLNSSAVAGSVWTPQTKFDRPPTWASSVAGFVGGLDDDFLPVIGEVVVPCAANNTYESPDSTTAINEKYIVTDKVCIASRNEVFGEISNGVISDSVMFPYYDNAISTDRIKYSNKTASAWWTRDPNQMYTYLVYVATSGGSAANYNPHGSNGVVPVFTIV